ncbi:MAG: hypothetical protein K0R18_831 [Bacillales bacterium]|jgi:uncharacterized protein YqgC (DUF456 family)|nr:hypothetical protein [Bacillales bacterium]
MDFIWWLLIVACFIGSFIALVKPIIPGVPLLLGGYLIFHLCIDNDELNFWFWLIQIVFTIFIFAVDILSNRYFLKKQGSSKLTGRIGMISIIIGAFILPPFGLVLVPFIAVYFTEIYQKKTSQQAAKIAFATVVSFLTSSFAKFIVQIIMIILFLIWII